MELRHLVFFLAVANEGNITKAAEALHTSQPNLSRQLKELEDLLGCTLLKRGKNISLTESGELLRRRAEEILSLTSKTEAELSESPEKMQGTITIGFGEMNIVQVVARLSVSFRNHYPNVRFDFFTGTADQVKEQMEKGLVDIGLLLEPVEIEKYDFFRLDGKVRFIAVMQNSSPLAQKETVSPQDLAHLPLVLPVRRNVLNEIFSWFGEYAQKLNIVASGNLSTNTAILVQNGMGTAIASEGISVPIDCENQIVCRPLSPELSFLGVMAWKKSKHLSPLEKTFLQFAKRELLKK